MMYEGRKLGQPANPETPSHSDHKVHSTQYSTWSISGPNTFFFAKTALIFYAFLLEKNVVLHLW